MLTGRNGDTAAGNRASSKILADPEAASLKRIAWAFGCSRKNSDEEAALCRLLCDRVARLRAATEAS